MAAAKAVAKRFTNAAFPQTRRCSSSAVCTVTSLADSARHSATVRTLEPISSPASQQLLTNCSTLRKVASWSGSDSSFSRISTSTSEFGKSSPRP